MSLKNLSAKTKIPKHLKSYLENKRINQIYKKFENSLILNESFAVAVSGGPDSLALAFLAKIYSLKKKISSKFFIVDHRLRPESTNEAKLVKNILKLYSINAQIISWKGIKPSKNIQSIARKKRFELLYIRCEKSKIKNILLGHHLDDLIENFFIRLDRGSGLKGLISLDVKSQYKDLNVVRPLLNQKKEDLIFLSKHVFNFFVDDPSNIDEKYKRTRIRKMIDEFKKNGLDKEKLLQTIKNLKYSNNVVDFYVNKNLNKNIIYFEKKNKLILNKNFFIQSYEVIFRSLSDCLRMVGKKYYPVRGKKLDRIISDIKNDSLSRVTLGGCIVEKVNQTIIISKEH